MVSCLFAACLDAFLNGALRFPIRERPLHFRVAVIFDVQFLAHRRAAAALFAVAGGAMLIPVCRRIGRPTNTGRGNDDCREEE